MSVKKNLLLLILSLSVTILFLGNINLISADTTSSAVSTSSSIASTATSSSSTTSSASASSSSSSSTTVFSSGIKWPTTSFAIWTQGTKEAGGLTRNKYGFMVNKDEGYYMEEYKDSNNIHVMIPMIAYKSWNKSTKTKYYVVMQSGSTFSGQEISSSNVIRTKIEDYSRTALWMLDVTVGNIKADKIQICIYDDDGSYGFWRTNGVADDGTYPFVMSTPVLGWNNVTNFNQSLKDGIFYVGRNTTLTMNAPKLQDSNVGKFDNSILNNAGESHFFGQNVVNNEIRTTYEITTDVTKLDGIVDGLASSDTNKYGLDTVLTYEIPSDNLKIPLSYGGLKAISLSAEALDNASINTKDYLESSFVDKVTGDLGTGHTLTYSWFYSTSDNINDLKKVSTEFTNNKDRKADGTLGTDWMTLSAKDDFTQYLEKQALAGKKIYLMMKVYVDGKLSTLTNPILVQIQVPTLKVPDKIDFGTISVKNIYNGGSFESLTKDSDKLSLSIPDTSRSTWKVTSSIKENDDNSITKINGQLNILGKNLSATPVEVASISKHGLVDLPLNAKVSFRGYHNPLTPRTNFTEDINWNLSPETPIMASN
ncbi:hypothetical protein [Ligilactobacillus salivarius]|uniref:Hypothetical secreted protein n=1 Tax=Ligilactobacillus salivarius (strain UCC118) TaxID=362948 RepID=Q1WV20_LIGS1|nr:hypothetical protein [Ligilactobacillus salivarius]ABD99165.1 Hypothetical secreted protein [Ligilactobacillus salivarius UCC118]ADJ78622.1 Hypothetical secreted protein [Ligilactobacillus salivarius CECT 5713]OQQ77735.1 hypothetical protein B6U64_01565 [Ligilactobacillus salivarius]OQR21718.1 hypothetical protein B6U40_01855 [Ligilactobacillus salivarius]